MAGQTVDLTVVRGEGRGRIGCPREEMGKVGLWKITLSTASEDRTGGRRAGFRERRTLAGREPADMGGRRRRRRARGSAGEIGGEGGRGSTGGQRGDGLGETLSHVSRTEKSSKLRPQLAERQQIIPGSLQKITFLQSVFSRRKKLMPPHNCYLKIPSPDKILHLHQSSYLSPSSLYL